MKIFIIITILLDLIAILLVSVSNKEKKVIWILSILSLPIIAAIITMYKLGTGAKYASSNDGHHHGGYSSGSGGGGGD